MAKKKATPAEKAIRRAEVIERRTNRLGKQAIEGKRPLFGKGKDKDES
ncbi:hypothetical protein ACH4RA_34555 [Streptomyces smyrnaeus]